MTAKHIILDALAGGPKRRSELLHLVVHATVEESLKGVSS
jgi:hypothetical protein